jgi:hypothetical protein
VPCDLTTLSTGKNSSTSCNCPSPLVWSPQQKSCDCGNDLVGVVNGTSINCVACSSSIYASSKKSSTMCSCLANLIWTGGVCQCRINSILTPNLICQNCGNYSTFNQYQCNCPPSYVWSNHYTSCVKCGKLAPNTLALLSSDKLSCVCSNSTY